MLMIRTLLTPLLCLVGFMLLLVACKTSIDTQPASTGKAINSFIFTNAATPVTGVVDSVIHTIRATVPVGTDLTKLLPAITLSPNAIVTPGSAVSQDFSKPVSYTVTSMEGLSQSYTVTVSVASTITNGGSLLYMGSGSGNFFAIDGGTGAVKWRVSTGSPITSSAYVAVGMVYSGTDNGNLYAFDALTGAQRWKFSAGNSILSSPIVSGSLVFAGSEDQNLYALNALTGTQQWKFSTAGGVSSSPVVVNGSIYFRWIQKYWRAPVWQLPIWSPLPPASVGGSSNCKLILTLY